MAPVTAAVVRGPTVRLGQMQCQRDWRGWARCTLIVVLFLAVTGCFAGAVYGARHRSRDVAYAVILYFLLVLLLSCVVKLEQLRCDPAAPVAERRRVRIAVWVVSVTLANTFASGVADAMPVLALKLAVWGVAVVVLGLACYFLFYRKDAECCNVEHGGGQADAGRRPERALHELWPEGV